MGNLSKVGRSSPLFTEVVDLTAPAAPVFVEFFRGPGPNEWGNTYDLPTHDEGSPDTLSGLAKIHHVWVRGDFGMDPTEGLDAAASLQYARDNGGHIEVKPLTTADAGARSQSTPVKLGLGVWFSFAVCED